MQSNIINEINNISESLDIIKDTLFDGVDELTRIESELNEIKQKQGILTLKGEVTIANGEIHFKICPFCGYFLAVKNGHYKSGGQSIQRYQCKSCGYQFSRKTKALSPRIVKWKSEKREQAKRNAKHAENIQS